MVDAKRFFEDYISVITKDYWDEYHNNTLWTDVVTKLIREQIENYGLESQTEYYRIDVTGWKSHWNDVKAQAKEVGMKPHLWDLEIAVEHENNSSDWSDELIKLAHIRCPLKVIIGYTPCDLRGVGGIEEARLAFASRILQKVKAFDPASKEQILVILGNSAPKESAHPTYTDYGYRGYYFDYVSHQFQPVNGMN